MIKILVAEDDLDLNRFVSSVLRNNGYEVISSFNGEEAYSYYENGERSIPTETLCRLADLYGVSIDYILGRTDERAPYPERTANASLGIA